MSTVALIGAGGLLGGLVARELASRGERVVAIGRGSDALRALDGCDVAIDVIAPMGTAGVNVARAACAAGVPLVDVAVEQTHLRAVHHLDDEARAAKVSLVPGVGFQHTLGDTLAHLAGSAVGSVREVHVAYTLPDRGAALAAASAGRRRSVAAELGVPALVLRHGELTEELAGEARRLAWFPRPVGPAHAAAIPGGEALSVPRHLPGVQGVSTYLAVPGWRAELLQATSNAARWAPAARWLTRRLERDRPGLGPARMSAIRWGCVAEAEGDDGSVARAWAYGHDPYRLTAASAVEVASRLGRGRASAGVLAASEVAAPDELLDRLAEITDLRWSISRPD